MALDYTKKTSRSRISIMNVIHVVLALSAIVLFIIAIIDTDKNKKLFPIIILIAAIMNGIDAIYKIRNLPRGKKNLSGVAVSIIICLVLLLIAFMVGVTIYT